MKKRTEALEKIQRIIYDACRGQAIYGVRTLSENILTALEQDIGMLPPTSAVQYETGEKTVDGYPLLGTSLVNRWKDDV